jgi:hypothetical protein
MLPVVIGHQKAIPETFEFVFWDQAHGVPPVYMTDAAASLCCRVQWVAETGHAKSSVLLSRIAQVNGVNASRRW